MTEQTTQRTTEQEVVGDQVVERTTVSQAQAAPKYGANKIIQAVYYLEGLLLALLALRFVLRLLGSSTASSFVNFIYMITYPFIAPFFGMFRSQIGYGAARLEFETLVAIAAYAILTYLIIGLIRLSK